MSVASAAQAHTAPSNTDAEEAVLGALLIDSGCAERITSHLKPSQFFIERHATIYAAVQHLVANGRKADFITVSDYLSRQGALDKVGGASYLLTLLNNVPTTVHAEHYAGIIARTSTYRQMVRAGSRIVQMAYEQAVDVDGTIAQAEQMLYELRNTHISGKVVLPAEQASRAWDRYNALREGKPSGISYGWHDLDALTGGAHDGQLIIVAGRTSIGKTALMVNIADNMAAQGKRVLFCSAEMSEDEITDRRVAARISRSVQALQSGSFGNELWDEVALNLSDGIAASDLLIYDEPDMTTAKIRSVATEVRSKHGLDALVVDYLQILHDEHGRSDNERVDYITRQLKAIARALEVPLICGSQLNRACEDRKDKRPQLSDLRDSGGVEQTADVVFLLYRASYYWPTQEEWVRAFGGKEPYPGTATAEVVIAKQRQGKRGVRVLLYWDGTTMQYRDMDTRKGEL